MKQWFENKTVAAVGNAMSLFDKDYGKEIDSHEVVVRMNKAAMLWERLDVPKSHGTRTDVWCFWNTVEYNRRFHEFKHIKKMHMSHQSRTDSNLKIVDAYYPQNLYDELKKNAGPRKNPTTGLMTLDYIVHCNPAKLTVYGFDFKNTPTFTDPTRKKEKFCPHNHDVEREYFFNRINILDNVVYRE